MINLTSPVSLGGFVWTHASVIRVSPKGDGVYVHYALYKDLPRKRRYLAVQKEYVAPDHPEFNSIPKGNFAYGEADEAVTDAGVLDGEVE